MKKECRSNVNVTLSVPSIYYCSEAWLASVLSRLSSPPPFFPHLISPPSPNMQNLNSHHSHFTSFLGLYKSIIWMEEKRKKEKVVCIKIFILFFSKSLRFFSFLHCFILYIFTSKYNTYYIPPAPRILKLSSSYSIPIATRIPVS